MKPTWNDPKTAPHDGTAIIARMKGYPFPVMATFSKASDKWCYAMLEVSIVDGEWDDFYFENEWADEDDIQGWMPLPKVDG